MSRKPREALSSTPVVPDRTPKRCAVYTRVSTDERLDQPFNSIDAQKEAGQAFIRSQAQEGWIPVADEYDDPAYSGGTMERPALKLLLADIARGTIDIIVVYKIDRLSRSLACFARLQSVTVLVRRLAEDHISTKVWITQAGRAKSGNPIDKKHLGRLLRNRIYPGPAVVPRHVASRRTRADH